MSSTLTTWWSNQTLNSPNLCTQIMIMRTDSGHDHLAVAPDSCHVEREDSQLSLPHIQWKMAKAKVQNFLIKFLPEHEWRHHILTSKLRMARKIRPIKICLLIMSRCLWPHSHSPGWLIKQLHICRHTSVQFPREKVKSFISPQVLHVCTPQLGQTRATHFTYLKWGRSHKWQLH